MNRLLLFVVFLLPLYVAAQVPNEQAAKKYDVDHLTKEVGTLKVIPFFLKKSNRFWFLANGPGSIAEYRSLKTAKKNIETIEDSMTVEVGITIPNTVNALTQFDLEKGNYYLVDPEKKTTQLLFDKPAILASLQALTKGQISKTPVTYSPQFSDDEQTVLVSYNGANYDYNFTTKVLREQPKKAAIKYPTYHTGAVSPDQKWIVYARHHNLYLKRIGNSSERALSNDGATAYSFAGLETDQYADQISRCEAKWTADSKHFYIIREDKRKIGTMAVTNSLSNPRPLTTIYKYEMPGDKNVVQYEFFTGSITANSLTKIDLTLWPDQAIEVIPSGGDLEHAFVLRRKRTRDEMDLCSVNLNTGKVQSIIREVSKPYINEDMFSVSILNSGNDIFWWSDRTGWGQYYHYNHDGLLLNELTKGNWTAGRIIATDSINRSVLLYGYGKEKDRNPYYAYVYKVDFDGKKQVLLTPENATHQIFLSPNKKYFVDNFSRIDLAPKSIVRDIEGNFKVEAYSAYVDKLYNYGWKAPEPFVVKAADGVTDLYGLMWKPFNFDLNKKYPVISQVYPGPQIETVWTDFTVFDRYNNTSLAQVGFIVVCMGHRGNSPLREASYAKYAHGNLRDNAIEDDIAGLKQLGAKNAFMDLSRVGIFGHSGGGMMSVAAICEHPEFYKVAVASSGNHDNTIYNRSWGETYQGFEKQMAINQSLAKSLKGKLLLVTGESDQNVNPSGTYRMADALIKADKNFDLLVLPGQSHTYEGVYKLYFQRRLREYFGEYLLK